MKHELEIATDHFQLLFGDREHGPNIDTTSLWSSNASVVVLSEPSEIVGIGTIRYGGKTRVVVEVAGEPPDVDPSWTPMGTFIVSSPTGELVFWGPEEPRPEEGPKVGLPHAGTYAGAVFSKGGEEVVDEMALDGPDIYRIVLWRA